MTAQQSNAGPASASEEPPKRAWRGSAIIWDHGVTVNTFDRGAQISHNPTYIQALSMRPRYHVGDGSLSLRLRQDIVLELTDSDSTSRPREPIFFDTRLDLVDPRVVEVAGIAMGLGARLALPVSLRSRAEGRVMGTGLLFYALRKLNTGIGTTSVAVSGGYQYNWSLRNTPIAEGGPLRTCAPIGGSVMCSDAGGLSAERGKLFAGLSLSMGMPADLSIDLDVAGEWKHGDDLADAYIDVPGEMRSLPDQSTTHWRNVTLFSVGLTHATTDWLSLSTGYRTVTTQLDPDGTRRNPLWNPDAELFFTLVILTDELLRPAAPNDE